jgi:hypothetical protein
LAALPAKQAVFQGALDDDHKKPGE